MAQRVVVQFVDDLDGMPFDSDGGGTVSFSLDGTSYEIDLSNANATRLRNGLAEFIASARKVGGRQAARRSGSSRASSSSGDAAAIREWARSKGMKVSERGRVSADIVEAYNAAH